MANIGLKKVRGRGVTNSCAPRKSTTKVVQVGAGEYVGKAAKRAPYINGARQRWENFTRMGANKSSTCGTQSPHSKKCR